MDTVDRIYCGEYPIYATVAQLVEQLIRNQQVAGSNPASSSKKTNRLSGRFVFCNYFDCSNRIRARA